MDFSNERYVRLYTRDTTTMKLLGWDGRNVLFHVLRRMDRSGVLDLEGVEPWEAVMLHCDAPEEAARRGVELCLRRGVLVVDGDRLVAPKFIEANETPQSDAQRARESRERRAMLDKQATVTKRDNESRTVTPPSQNDTPPSQPVTPSHTASQSVTPCCSVPSVPSVLSLPSHAEPSGSSRDGGRTWLAALVLIREANPKQDPQMFDPGSYREALEWIASKPPDEFETVLKHYAKASWVVANPGKSHPNYIRKNWDALLEGEARKPPPRPGSGGRSGPAPATAFDDFEAQPLGAFDG